MGDGAGYRNLNESLAATKVVDNHSYLQLNGGVPLGTSVMYVCICNAVTDRQIREAAASGARTFADVRRRTGCGDCCGSCEDLAAEIFDKAAHARTLDLPLIAIAA